MFCLTDSPVHLSVADTLFVVVAIHSVVFVIFSVSFFPCKSLFWYCMRLKLLLTLDTVFFSFSARCFFLNSQIQYYFCFKAKQQN